MNTTIALALILTSPAFGLIACFTGEPLIGVALVLNGVFAFVNLMTMDGGI